MQMQQIHVCKYSSAPFRCVLTLLSSSAEKHSSVSSTAPPSSGSNVMPGWSVTFAHSVTPKSNMFVIVVGSYLGHMTSENSGGISTHVSMTTSIAQVQVTTAPCYPLVKVFLLRMSEHVSRGQKLWKFSVKMSHNQCLGLSVITCCKKFKVHISLPSTVQKKTLVSAQGLQVLQVHKKCRMKY